MWITGHEAPDIDAGSVIRLWIDVFERTLWAHRQRPMGRSPDNKRRCVGLARRLATSGGGRACQITQRTPLSTSLTIFLSHRTSRSGKRESVSQPFLRNRLSPLSPENVVYAGLAFRNSPRFPHLWSVLLITTVISCKKAIFLSDTHQGDGGFLNRRNPICGVQCHVSLWKMCHDDSTMARRFRHETSRPHARGAGCTNER